jgi:hypothetical protein
MKKTGRHAFRSITRVSIKYWQLRFLPEVETVLRQHYRALES